MSGNQGGKIRIPAAKQHRSLAVIELRQAEAAVLSRNLDAESTHREQVVDVLLRNLAGTIDFVGINVCLEVFPELFQEGLAFRPVFFGLRRIRKNPSEVVTADEQI